MAGKIKMMIDKIIRTRAGSDPSLQKTTRLKLVLKGIDPDKFSMASDDDNSIISKLQQIASDMGVAV